MNNNDSATETTNTRPTSGFTTNIKEITDADPMTGNNEYKNLKEFYVSESGHTRLFTATKYGKRFMLKCLKKWAIILGTKYLFQDLFNIF